MRISSLVLKAYGHFTDMSLDLSSEMPGLHIIFGPNEAGKSTALRALRGLLYGIDARTPDNFLHDYGKLMIGGHLQDSEGKELVFWRRKRNVGSLLDADMNVLDPAVLNDFLQGVGETLFDSLFGIDHETLVSGGSDILEQRGDVGQALFSAGAGLSSLHGIIGALEIEGAALFKAGGSRPELNSAIRVFDDLKKDIRDLSLSGQSWKEQQELFESVSAGLERAEAERNSCRASLERLKRLQRAMTYLSRRRAVLDGLKALGDLGHLPEDFPERLSEIREKAAKSLERLKEADSRRISLEERRAQCSVRQGVLDQAESIEALNQRLDALRQARKDRPDLHEKMIRCRTEASMLLNQVLPGHDLSGINEITALLGRRQEILRIGNRCAGLREVLQQAEKRTRELEKAFRKAQEELEAAPSVTEIRGLSAAITTARKAGDPDSLLLVLDQDITMLRSSAERGARQLPLLRGPVEDLLSLPIPSSDTVNRFADELREASAAVREAEQRELQLQEELDRITCDLRAMEKSGTVPSEKELIRIRGRRDQGWRLVRRSWLEKGDISEELRGLGGDKELPEVYEEAVRAADDAADRLRADAERVHNHAGLTAQAEKLAEQIQRARLDAGKAGELLSRTERSWQAAWEGCNLTPLSPGEMRSWLEQCLEIIRTLQSKQQKEGLREPLRAQRQGLREMLLSELKTTGRDKEFLGEELGQVLAYAEDALEELKENNDRRLSTEGEMKRLRRDLEAAREELKTGQRDMTAWQGQWKGALEGLGLAGETSPEDASEALEKLRQCLDQWDKAQGFEQRLATIDQYRAEFSGDAVALVQSAAPELSGLPPEQATVKLQALLTEARKASSVMEKLTEDMEAAEEAIRQAHVELKLSAEKREELLSLARCGNDGQLEEIAKNFREFISARKDLIELEERLLGIAEGIPLEELEEQAAGADPNSLPGETDALEQRLKGELEPLIRELSEKKGEARIRLQQMDGSGKAAEKEEEAQQALARVRRLAEQYVRLRIAAQLLKREVDRYRQENQDPILRVASRYFSDLTVGAFSGLRTDLDDSGRPVLVGLCLDGRIKEVGEMSSGTRDQLYLALRMATLEWRLERHEPMPFIADDILVNFDDARARATLKALATLSGKNQVILFTHHSRIVETARSLGLNKRIFVHPLGQRQGAELTLFPEG